ncbi:phosphotransferase [Oceanobacillus saliphilus]|uniref:phosphotransferase n=1 Tax=Oceanobacillus saliphilus TaxID=2925834 RepID=UPI00201D4638|nr:phosphotransferase [Oceanobacillus saliphilus]
MMDSINEVMQAYKVYPIATEKITDRLYLVKDGQRKYALKRSRLKEADIAAWQRIYYIANQKNLSEIVPIYLTKDGIMYYEKNQSYFYLTPWIEKPSRHDRKDAIENSMFSLANLHGKTKTSQRISINSVKQNFNTYQAFCKQVPDELHAVVLQFEKNRYMSPFELLVCTQYRDLEYASKMNNDIINEFLDQKDEYITWNSCLCHGNLKQEHILNRHILNWEKARFDQPAVDLANYINNMTGDYDQSVDMITGAFKIYKEKNDLTGLELKLLSIYLLNPSPYITVIREYLKKPSDRSIADQIKDIQRHYRRIIFAIKWREFMKEEYESISFDDSSF